MKKFLSIVLIIIAAICAVIALLCTGGLFSGALFGLAAEIWGLLGLGAFIVAAALDPETVGEIVDNVAEVAGDIMGGIGGAAGSLVSGLFSNPIVWIVGGACLYFYFSNNNSSEEVRIFNNGETDVDRLQEKERSRIAEDPIVQ